MIFSATIPEEIQEIISTYMEDAVMIDLVGDSENQLPDKLVNKAVVASSFDSIMGHIQKFVTNNKDKKTLIFCETKDDVR